MGVAVRDNYTPVDTPFTLELDFYAANTHVVGVIEMDGAGKLDRVGLVAFAIENGERGVETVTKLACRTRDIAVFEFNSN